MTLLHPQKPGLKRRPNAQRKLTQAEADRIRRRYADGENGEALTIEGLAAEKHVSRQCIWNILHNITYRNSLDSSSK